MSEQIREMLWAPSAQRIANSKMALDPRHPNRRRIIAQPRSPGDNVRPAIHRFATLPPDLLLTSVCRHTRARPMEYIT